MSYRMPLFIRQSLSGIVLAIIALLAIQCSLSAQVVVQPPNTKTAPDPNTQDPVALPTAPPSGQLFSPQTGQTQPQMALSEILGEADLKPHRNIDRLPPLWPYYLGFGLLGLLILLVAIIYFVRRNRRPKPVPFVPADIRALAALEEVRPLIREAKSREFSYQTSEIIRAYIEERFGIEARNRTTREFLMLAARPDSTLPSRYESALNEFLHYCDLAKFAKQIMQPKQLESMFNSAKQFIKDTRPSIMATQALGKNTATVEEVNA